MDVLHHQKADITEDYSFRSRQTCLEAKENTPVGKLIYNSGDEKIRGVKFWVMGNTCESQKER